MTLSYNEEKPPLEDLYHHGVKGMKWGHRKKYATSDIKDARARQDSRRADINNTAAKLNLAKGKQAEGLAKKYNKQMDDFNKNPDAAVAARMTKGEKAASVLIGGPIGLLVIAGNSAAVKSIEKKNGPAKK